MARCGERDGSVETVTRESHGTHDNRTKGNTMSNTYAQTMRDRAIEAMHEFDRLNAFAEELEGEAEATREDLQSELEEEMSGPEEDARVARNDADTAEERYELLESATVAAFDAERAGEVG